MEKSNETGVLKNFRTLKYILFFIISSPYFTKYGKMRDVGNVHSKKMAGTNLANLFFRLDLSLDLAVLVHVTAIVVVLEILIKKSGSKTKKSTCGCHFKVETENKRHSFFKPPGHNYNIVTYC